MSQPAVSQPQRDEPVGGDSCRTVNGIESTNHGGSAHIDPPHFGMFNDQVQRDVQRLQDGLTTVDGAIAELTKTFSQHGEIVKAVGKRWGTDQVLEEEIRTLRAAKDGIWAMIERDREKYNSMISDLKKEHENEVSMLQAHADAGEQEKKKYEEMERHLRDQHNKALKDMNTDLKQKKTQLEKENAETIVSLRRQKTELENAKAKLEQDLKERTKERDQEKETRVTMQDKLWKDIGELQNTLSDIRAKYQVDKQPSQYYLDRYHALIHSVGEIATSYFENLPDKAINEPAGTSTRLAWKAPIFAKIPIADSDCSQVLRLASVQHVIFNVICGSLWRPFFSKYLWKNKQDRSPLAEIHSRLAARGEDVQQNWRVSTLMMLDQLDDGVDVGEQVDHLIAEKVIACLQPLLDDSQANQFKDDLKVIFTDAIELGKIVERDQSPVFVDRTPSASDRDGWKEYLSDDYETGDASDLSATSPAMDSPLEVLFVSPKIFRRTAKGAATAAMPTTSATATAAAAATTTAIASRPEVEVIQPGLALFAGTGIFQEGASDWQRISNAGREAAKNINGKARRQSINTSMTSSAILPRSPQQPSKGWSREGTHDFN